jgi:hypothetical protein
VSRIAGFDSITSIDYQMASARAREAAAERDELMNALDDTVSRDRDETRRLLYMALVAGRTKRYNLVGTLVNALAHHLPPDERIDPDEAANVLIEAVQEYGTYEERQTGLAWVRERIAALTAAEESARSDDDPA